MLKTSRNLSLECCKLLAASFVVFLHIPFPGTFGRQVVYLSRFAVPLFFAVSGWFSFGVSADKLKKRLGHILLLELTGELVYMTWWVGMDCFWGEPFYQSLMRHLPDMNALKLWLLWNVDPFSGHLWYLSATALCYAVLWVYHRITREKKDYRPLYILSVFLLLGCFAMGEFSGFTGLKVDYRIYRSGIFTGIPLFFMGVFLRDNRQKLTGWGLPLLVLGVALSLLEGKYIGFYDLYIGSVLTAAAVLLLTDRYPAVPGWLAKPAASFGSVSTTVYLLHLLLQYIYQTFFQWWTVTYMAPQEAWLQPLLILGVSMIIGFCWNALQKVARKAK